MEDSKEELADNVKIETIMQEIRQQVLDRTRPSQVSLPKSGDHLPPEFYEQLYRAFLAQNQLSVKIQIVKSTVPIIGGIIDRLRMMFHQLVLFYVQRLAAQQVEVNRHLLEALSTLSQYLEEEKAGEQ